MAESRYEIPPGCICLGDGLMGMKCEAPEHARPKPISAAIQRLMDEVRQDRETPRVYDRAHLRHNRS